MEPPAKQVHRFWTPEEIALLGTKPPTELVPILNRDIVSIRRKIYKLGIGRTRPFKKTQDEIANELWKKLKALEKKVRAGRKKRKAP